MNIAIMGATSHIARGLIYRFLHNNSFHLHLFTRSEDRLRQFLASIDEKTGINYDIYTDYNLFPGYSYDVIINCIGVEARNKDNCDFTRYFSVTEEYDNLIIKYLRNHNPAALYISLSSGAVYGGGFSAAAQDSSVNCINVNNTVAEDYYGIARINAEAKHRAYKDLKIADLRIFSYFSRFINLADGYFITDVMQAILKKKVLVTDGIDIVRDYLHPEDLFAAINKCVAAGKLNLAFDVNSSCPAAKQEILDYFSAEYGLRYEKRDSSKNASATGLKKNYYSTSRRAHAIGYVPRFSSLDTLKNESRYILSNKVITGRED